MISERGTRNTDLGATGRYYILGSTIGTIYLVTTFAGGMQIANAVVSPVFIPSGVEVLNQPLFWVLALAASSIVLLKGKRYVASQVSTKKKVSGGILFFLSMVAVYLALIAVLLSGIGLFLGFFYFLYGLPLILGLAVPAFFALSWAWKNDGLSPSGKEFASKGAP